jgi:ribosome-binding protein aMBF1 (putative translation factor)
MDGCHFDDEPLNNRSWNLRWDTKKANHDDALRNGRRPWGEFHQSSKLTAEIVRIIRAAYASREMNQPQLARKFGVGQNQISRIVLRRLWVHLD